MFFSKDLWGKDRAGNGSHLTGTLSQRNIGKLLMCRPYAWTYLGTF